MTDIDLEEVIEIWYRYWRNPL